MVAAAAVLAGGAIVAGGATAAAGSAAAGAQSAAARSATNAETNMFNQTQSNLSPFIQSGTEANNALLQGLGLGTPALTSAQENQAFVALRNKYGGNDALAGAEYSQRLKQGPQGFADLVPGLATPDTGSMAAGSLIAPFNPTEAQLEATPGYQFNLEQGQKAVTNANAARGLGVSGAALKGAATFASGLADSTYQNQFNNYQTQQTNVYNRLAGLAQLGQGSAAGVGSIAQQTGSSIGGNLIGAGNAQGAADMSVANSLGQSSNNLSNLLVLQSLTKNGGAGIFSGNSGTGGGAMGP